MQTYHVHLSHPVSKSFRSQRAADALDIDTAKKSVHDLIVEADLETPYHVGLIVGASGSGKTTLARTIFGDDALTRHIEDAPPVIEQFPKEWSYDQCAAALVGVGLTSVPCWIRPVYTLSTGQRARAEAALLLAHDTSAERPAVIDEWTSVVDRTVAKVMSHCVQKHARRSGGRIVLCSCHYDVLDWLNPDWVIDCNTGSYQDRRSLWQGFQRAERLSFEIREVNRRTWRAFSKYHYLSERLPGGRITTFGLFYQSTQIGFQCFAEYTVTKLGKIPIMHSNRTVIHPDYAGLGLGIRLITITSREMLRRGVRVMAKFTSTPVYRAMSKDPEWQLREISRNVGRSISRTGSGMMRGMGARRDSGKGGFRLNVKAYHFEFIGPAAHTATPAPTKVPAARHRQPAD